LPDDIMEKFWEADIDEIREDVQNRLDEGRGVLGVVDPDLPKVIAELQDKKNRGK
jgi:adenosine/AMP kinase